MDFEKYMYQCPRCMSQLKIYQMEVCQIGNYKNKTVVCNRQTGDLIIELPKIINIDLMLSSKKIEQIIKKYLLFS